LKNSLESLENGDSSKQRAGVSESGILCQQPHRHLFPLVVVGQETHVIQKNAAEDDASGPWHHGTQVYSDSVGQVSMSKLIQWQHKPQGTPPVPMPVRVTLSSLQRPAMPRG